MFSSRKSCKPLAVTQVSNNKMLSSPVRSFFYWSGRQFWLTSDKCWKKKGRRWSWKEQINVVLNAGRTHRPSLFHGCVILAIVPRAYSRRLLFVGQLPEPSSGMAGFSRADQCTRKSFCEPCWVWWPLKPAGSSGLLHPSSRWRAEASCFWHRFLRLLRSWPDLVSAPNDP